MKYRDEFDTEDLFVPPQLNKSTHSEVVQFAVQSSFLRAIDECLELRDKHHLPWRQRKDVFRYCIRAGVERIATVLKSRAFDSAIGHAFSILEDDIAEEQRTAYLQVFERLRARMLAAQGSGDEIEKALVGERYRSIKRHIEQMATEPKSALLWRMRYEDKLAEFKALEEW